MPFKRRRYSNDVKKPASMPSYVTGTVGVVAILLCALMIFASAQSAGNTPAVFALLGIAALISSLLCTIYGVKYFRDDTHSAESRWLGMLSPMAALVVWASIYIYGMI